MSKVKTVHDLGQLEVATGCMFAGKTSALIQEYRDIQPFRPIVAFKPEKDNRYSKTNIVSHSDSVKSCPRSCKSYTEDNCGNSKHWIESIPAIPFKELSEIDKYLKENKEIGDLIIDELHFLPTDTYQ